MIEAYPLYWPEGWKRTQGGKQNYSKFKTGFGAAREFLFGEIRRMDGNNQILSTNVPLRNDGMPRANMPEPRDRGVAVYFTYQKKSMVFACDKYVNVRDNIYAIAKTIEALRGIERWGASDMLERAFRGFTALPEHAATPWRVVMKFSSATMVTEALLHARFRELAMQLHPDNSDTGNSEQFKQLVEAREMAKKELAL
ncbi:MAG TPA: J domain-containing protein [Clostridia bacterium]|nr:J domain-containing protein [Clostridia bacterium]